MLSLIVARSENNVIGKKGRIPWRIRGEQQQFRALTLGKAVIMGRISYEEIGHPLPGRLNIVVSGSRCFSGENLVTVRSLEEAIQAAGERDAFVAGGAGLFAEALPKADVLYITEVHLTVEEGDTFFPPFDPSAFVLETGETLTGELMTGENEDAVELAAEQGGKEVSYTRTIYRRRPPSPCLKEAEQV